MSEQRIIVPDKFGEWQIIKQQMDELQKFLNDERKLTKVQKYAVFGVGSPRHMNVVVRWDTGQRHVQKIILVDVQAGSWQFWLEVFDKMPWIEYEF